MIEFSKQKTFVAFADKIFSTTINKAFCSYLAKPHIMLPSCLCGVFKHNYKIHIIASYMYVTTNKTTHYAP